MQAGRSQVDRQEVLVDLDDVAEVPPLALGVHAGQQQPQRFGSRRLCSRRPPAGGRQAAGTREGVRPAGAAKQAAAKTAHRVPSAAAGEARLLGVIAEGEAKTSAAAVATRGGVGNHDVLPEAPRPRGSHRRTPREQVVVDQVLQALGEEGHNLRQSAVDPLLAEAAGRAVRVQVRPQLRQAVRPAIASPAVQAQRPTGGGSFDGDAGRHFGYPKAAVPTDVLDRSPDLPPHLAVGL